MILKQRDFFVGAALCLWGVPAAHAGELAAAVRSDVDTPAQLVVFDTDAPGELLLQRLIVGLAFGEAPAALDSRPASGELWLLTSTNRLYVLESEHRGERAPRECPSTARPSRRPWRVGWTSARRSIACA